MRTTDPGSQFGFLMVPKFSLGALSSAIESLRLANYVSGQTLYEWRTVSADGEAVASSAGLSVAADLSIGDAERLSTVFVCGGIDTHLFEDSRLAIWLRQIERRGMNIGALCTGSHFLARLGLLDGYRCTIHWENLPGFIEDFPNVDVSEDIFVRVTVLNPLEFPGAPWSIILQWVRDTRKSPGVPLSGPEYPRV